MAFDYQVNKRLDRLVDELRGWHSANTETDRKLASYMAHTDLRGSRAATFALMGLDPVALTHQSKQVRQICAAVAVWLAAFVRCAQKDDDRLPSKFPDDLEQILQLRVSQEFDQSVLFKRLEVAATEAATALERSVISIDRDKLGEQLKRFGEILVPEVMRRRDRDAANADFLVEVAEKCRPSTREEYFAALVEVWSHFDGDVEVAANNGPFMPGTINASGVHGCWTVLEPLTVPEGLVGANAFTLLIAEDVVADTRNLFDCVVLHEGIPQRLANRRFEVFSDVTLEDLEAATGVEITFRARAGVDIARLEREFPINSGRVFGQDPNPGRGLDLGGLGPLV